MMENLSALKRPSKVEKKKKRKLLDEIKDEMKFIHDNYNFDLVKLPKGKRALDNKWIYKVKHDSNSTSPRYKAKLGVKGYSQRKGVDFNEILSPVVKIVGQAASIT